MKHPETKMKFVKGEIKWSHSCEGILKWSGKGIKAMGLMHVLTGGTMHF